MKIEFSWPMELGELKAQPDMAQVTVDVTPSDGGYVADILKVSLLLCGQDLDVKSELTERTVRYMKEEAIGIFIDAANVMNRYQAHQYRHVDGFGVVA